MSSDDDHGYVLEKLDEPDQWHNCFDALGVTEICDTMRDSYLNSVKTILTQRLDFSIWILGCSFCSLLQSPIMVTTFIWLSVITSKSKTHLSSILTALMTINIAGFTDEVIRVLIIENDRQAVATLLADLENPALPRLELHWDRSLDLGIARMGRLRFDVILLDSALPACSNVEGLRKIRAQDPKVMGRH